MKKTIYTYNVLHWLKYILIRKIFLWFPWNQTSKKEFSALNELNELRNEMFLKIVISENLNNSHRIEQTNE